MRGETIRSKEVEKHRTDVFRLALTLPAEPGEALPAELTADLSLFLAKNHPDHPDWIRIAQAIRDTIGGNISAQTLIDAVKTYYRIP